MIYLDNNATTMMSVQAKTAMVKWCNAGNPSADYASAKDCRSKMEDLRKLIGSLSDISTCCTDKRDVLNKRPNAQANSFRVVFTSGGSESNATVIHNTVSIYGRHPQKPHICYSALEHKSILDCINSYVQLGLCDASVIPATVSGHITTTALQRTIRPTTKLVCVMQANNETGVCNDIHALGLVAHSVGAHMHSDTVQSYGKFPLRPRNCIDSFAISFHKMGGPPGVGALCIRESALRSSLIHGSQNDSLRGGTENMPGLAASFVALTDAMTSREQKNITQLQLKEQLYVTLSKSIPSTTYAAYYNSRQVIKAPVYIVFLSGQLTGLPGTILLSVVSHQKTICNAEIKGALAKKNIIISVGSACNTASANASHILYAMGADEVIRRGALRISIGDCNVPKDIEVFCKEFIAILSRL